MKQNYSFFRILLRTYYYVSRFVMFIFISLRVLFHGLTHPQNMFNFFFGVVTEIAEFHKRCRNNPHNFKESRLYRKIIKELPMPQSNCFSTTFGTIRPQEGQVMGSLISVLKPKVLFEFGTYYGFSTLHLLKNSPKNSIIHTLDLPPDSPSSKFKHDLNEAHRDMKNIEKRKKRLFENDEEKDRVIEHFCDSTTFDYTPFHKKVDFVFIDANHSYAFVKLDTENALKMLSPNGVILWHDYDFIHPGIFRYINELSFEKKIHFIERTRFAIYINKA